MKKLFLVIMTVVMVAAPALAKSVGPFWRPERNTTSILRSLPPDVQKQIKVVRDRCSGKHETKGDEGLRKFIFNGTPVLFVDTYCGTGDAHAVEIYFRKDPAHALFSTWAQGPIHLNIDRHGNFESINLRVWAGKHGCPESGVPRAACDSIVQWNGKAFTYTTTVVVEEDEKDENVPAMMRE